MTREAAPPDVMLAVENLCAWYGAAQILYDLSFEVRRGEVVAFMGRNGAGKTTTMKAIMGLMARRSGSVRFDGHDISRLSQRQLRPLRQQMQIIFQDPYSSLNPRKSVGQIIGEPYTIHRTERDVKRRVQDLLYAN